MSSIRPSTALSPGWGGTQLDDGLATALEKIKTLLSKRAMYHFENIHENVFVKSIARHDYSAQDKEIAILNRAIDESRAVKVHYKSARNGKTFESLMHPYGLVVYGTDLYCIGRLIDRGEHLEEQESNLKRRFYKGRPTWKYRRILSQLARLKGYGRSVNTFLSDR